MLLWLLQRTNFKSVCVYACVYVCICVFVHMQCTSVRVGCVRAIACVCDVCVRMCVCMCMRIRACVMCAYVCVLGCTWVYVGVCSSPTSSVTGSYYTPPPPSPPAKTLWPGWGGGGADLLCVRVHTCAHTRTHPHAYKETRMLVWKVECKDIIKKKKCWWRNVKKNEEKKGFLFVTCIDLSIAWFFLHLSL